MSIGFKGNVKPSAKWTTWLAVGVMYALHGLRGKQFVITSMNDSEHKKGSLHYSDDAFDIRVWYVTAEERADIIKEARSLLEPLGYDVISVETPGHDDHDHVEYDPKAGETVIKVVK